MCVRARQRGGTHDVRAVGVVERARGAAVAGEHLRHVLRLVLGEAHEAHAGAREHLQLVFLLKVFIFRY